MMKMWITEGMYVKLQERPSASRCSIVRSQILVFNAAKQEKRTFSPLIKYSVDKMYFVEMHFVGFTKYRILLTAPFGARELEF